MALTDVDTLADDVVNTVQDSDAVDATKAIADFNRCLYSLARVVRINDLAAVGTIDTVVNQNYAALPSNFHSHLAYCRNNDINQRIKVYGSRRIIERKLATVDKAGNVALVARDGRNLYYQGIPASAMELQVYYHRTPTTLVVGGEFPDYIPEDLAYKLFFNFGCWTAYEKVEQGVEGEKTSTVYHEGQYNKAMKEAKLWFGPDADDPYIMEDTHQLFDFNSMV